MAALHQHENGTWTLLPWCMPRSVGATGEEEDQGRFCIAFSRDGWHLLDAELWIVLGWYASEEAAVAARSKLVLQRCRDCGGMFPYSEDADRCASCVAEMVV